MLFNKNKYNSYFLVIYFFFFTVGGQTSKHMSLIRRRRHVGTDRWGISQTTHSSPVCVFVSN